MRRDRTPYHLSSLSPPPERGGSPQFVGHGVRSDLVVADLFCGGSQGVLFRRIWLTVVVFVVALVLW